MPTKKRFRFYKSSGLELHRTLKKKNQSEVEQLMKRLTPEERRLVQQQEKAAQTRSQTLTAALKRPGPKRLQDIGKVLELRQVPEALENPERFNRVHAELAKLGKKKGSGIRKPPRRKSKANPEEKKKDRIRLVVAQIKAGNTNPKLIVEVDKLYKDFNEIENAHMMLK
jgi:hypothetical protein